MYVSPQQKKENIIKYPEPHDVFKEKPSVKKYLRYLLFFGPGAIIASLTIGQGQLIIGPQIGAWAGYSLLWLITISVGSFVIAYVSCRFTMLSGIGIMDLFAIKTKKGWFNWLILIIMLIFIPIFAASILTAMGQALNWIFGFGHYLIWGISFEIIAGLIVLLGRYKLLELSHAFFVVVLALGAIISVIMIKPDIGEMLPNFFTLGQNVPNSYPSWVDQVKGFTKTPIPLTMLAYLGTLNFTLVALIGYLGWIKIKKWGVFKDQKDPNDFSHNVLNLFKKNSKIDYLSSDPKEVKKSRLLLKPLSIDLGFAFIVVAIVSAAYMVAGTTHLGPKHLLPSDINLLKQQAVIFTEIASWLDIIFKISVFFALFGTVYGAFEAAGRMLYETGGSIIKRFEKIEYKKFMWYLFIYIIVLSIPLAILMYKGLSVLLMLSITLLFIGVVGVILYGIAAIYLSQKYLPKEYRLGKLGLFLAIVSVFIQTIPFYFLVL